MENGLMGGGRRGARAAVVDITFFAVWAVAVLCVEQGRVIAAAAETEPHHRQVHEEENVGYEDKDPGNRDGPSVRKRTLRDRDV